LLQLAERDAERTFTLVECPGGTGQITNRLRNDEIDVGIALTDALIAGIANGAEFYRLVGSYVITPLNWAVITGKDSKYEAITDLRGTTIGISRPGSGSQTMAAVMAMQQGWFENESNDVVEKFQFKVNNNIDGLIASINDGSTSAFLWEWFTTKPYADQGLVRFIGSVPTPWPSWMIAAHTSPTRAPPGAVRSFLDALTPFATNFNLQSNKETVDVEYIKAQFHYAEEDINAWLSTVGYPADVGVVDLEVVSETLGVLELAGVVKKPDSGAGFKPEYFVNASIARLAQM